MEALLILDLDETLIWATEDEPSAGFDFSVGHYFVTKRPHLDAFLERVFSWFRVAVWTSSSEAYAARVVEQVFGDPGRLEFVWSRARCTERYDEQTGEHFFLKNLKKVKQRGYDLDRVLILDDSPEKVSKNFGNYVRLEPFQGDPADRQLADVLPFLERLKDHENFRVVEKRGWNRKAEIER